VGVTGNVLETTEREASDGLEGNSTETLAHPAGAALSVAFTKMFSVPPAATVGAKLVVKEGTALAGSVGRTQALAELDHSGWI
jgi:hypothetical protein